MPKVKSYSGAVDTSLAAQLLNSTGVLVDGVPLGDALQDATAKVVRLTEQANKALEDSEFAPIIADHLATKMGRKGPAMLVVLESGQVTLGIKTTPKRRSSTAPLMKELKERAKRMGVDISEFGIKRKKIYAYLEEIDSGKKAKKDSKLLEDGGPMSAGPDEIRVSPPPDEVKPPKKGFMKTSQALGPSVAVPFTGGDPAPTVIDFPKPKDLSAKGRSMRDLVKDAAEVSISDLLASEPPE